MSVNEAMSISAGTSMKDGTSIKELSSQAEAEPDGATTAAWLWTWRMASIRPRGEYRSSPVTRKVGQWGKHSPQLTQAARSSSNNGSFNRTPS